MRATTAITATLVAAMLMGTCYCAESGDSSSETKSGDEIAAAAAAEAAGDGSRFGNARPASARASTPDAPTAPSPPTGPTSTPAPFPALAAASTVSPAPAPTAPALTAPARTLSEGEGGVPLPATAPEASSDASANVLRSVGAPPLPSKSGRSISGWNMSPNTQYHIQTDEGPERYFKYQTISGQYRKEKRLQDGTVVGTYGWVDPNGYLRLRDYVADNTGYRVLKTKMVYVGKEESIGSAVSKAKYSPSQGGSAYVPPGSTAPATTPAPYTQQPYAPSLYTSNPLLYPSVATPPSNSLSGSYYNNNYNPPYNTNPYYPSYDGRRFDLTTFGQRIPPQQPQAPFPQYDGISATHNGFRYYLPRQYHEEETLPRQQTAGSFGYIDPFGIRRVIYYNTSPGSGFVHRKNNRYVGFNATPYDPRF